MIATVTCNPSLDYYMRLAGFEEGQVNRAVSQALRAGGKGINVSRVLSTLGVDTRILGFAAGFTGRQIESSLKEAGCDCDFIFLKEGMSRINVKIQAQKESEINASGPVIGKEAMEELYQKLETLTGEDMLVLAGSLAPGMPKDFYKSAALMMKEKNVPVIVDTEGDALLEVLSARPFLIKPNHHELKALFGGSNLIEDAKRLQSMGARNVLVSMAQKGAVLLAENGEIYEKEAPKGKAVNSVGAGDSMVAGFLAGYLKFHSYKDALSLGIAAGSASAFKDDLANRTEIQAIFEKSLLAI